MFPLASDFLDRQLLKSGLGGVPLFGTNQKVLAA
jgi:hypothetical protein